MSRTRRAYNLRPLGGGYSGPTFHPYHQLCMGHCRTCKRHIIKDARQRKRLLRKQFEDEIRNEQRQE